MVFSLNTKESLVKTIGKPHESCDMTYRVVVGGLKYRKLRYTEGFCKHQTEVKNVLKQQNKNHLPQE